MNSKYKKLVIAITGAAFIAGGLAPVFPHALAAIKWDKKLPQTQAAATPIAEEATPAAIADLLQETEDNEQIMNTEAVITESNDAVRRVVISSIGKQTAVAPIEQVIADKLQQEVERGNQQWLLDPVAVIKNNAGKYGFDAKKDSFTLISQAANSPSRTGKAYVLVGHSTAFYIVELVQPASSSHNKIWQIISIKEATVNQPQKPNKPDVGPGVEGLDYDRVIKWQQAVDAGRELWRLNPIEVAKNEGKNYGFSNKDQFTIIRKLNSSPLSRHGQIDVEVIHNDKKYTMILVKPFGGNDAIWTTYKVTGTVIKPGTPVISEKVLYSTDKYKNWQWFLPQYPQGTGVAAMYSYDLQAKSIKLQQVPQTVIDKLQNVDLTNKVALVAYLGGTSSSNNIGIEKVTVKGSDLTVTVRTRSPRIDAPMTMDYVNPSDYVLIDRKLFETTGDMNVTFIDQNKKVLGNIKISL